MLDPLFGIPIIGTPFALLYLMGEARLYSTSEPSFGAWLVMALAGYGVFLWNLAVGIFLFKELFDSGSSFVQIGAGCAALVMVAVPFTVSAHLRKQRAVASLQHS